LEILDDDDDDGDNVESKGLGKVLGII